MPDSLLFRPLASIRIADFSRALAGPYCTLLLADLGAQVVKIESPEGDETRHWAPPFVEFGGRPQSSYFAGVNRNKRSLVLDLKQPQAVEIARRLIASSDVLVENFRPGVMRSFGLDSDAVLAACPRLIWCSLTAFGQDGPWSSWKGYDLIVQAVSGLMDLTGMPDGPPTKVGVAISDLAAGLHGAVAILAALVERQATGRGRALDIALLDSALALLSMYAPGVLNGGYRFSRVGNAHPQIVPYQEFATADEPIVVAVTNEALWKKFCGVLGLPRLAADFAGNDVRCRRRDELVPRLEARLRQRPAGAWLEALGAAGIPVAPVSNLAAVLSSPQVEARSMIQRLEGGRLIANPITRANTPAEPPPALGADTSAVLQELGYNPQEIARFAASGVFGASITSRAEAGNQVPPLSAR